MESILVPGTVLSGAVLAGVVWLEGKWLIADRDLNEREGLKWLLKASSVPVTNVYLAADYQEFVMLFERETPDVVLVELDMIGREDWPSFRDLIQIYCPILMLTSAEATFERARMALDIQALELMIKPFSTVKVKSAFQKAARTLSKRNSPGRYAETATLKDISYESLFWGHSEAGQSYHLAAFKTEFANMTEILHSFLSDYPFREMHGVFALKEQVILLFNNQCQNISEQCLHAMRKWEEEFSEPLAIVIHTGSGPLHEKFAETTKLLQITYYNGYYHVMEFAAAPDWVYIDPFLDPYAQKSWIAMLSCHDLEKIKSWLYDEFLQLRAPFPDPDLIRIRLTSILAQIRRFMKTNELDELENVEGDYRRIFNSILYDSVLYRTVQNLILFMQKIFLRTSNISRNTSQGPVELGVKYMEAHFSNSTLKLEDVARHVDRNPSYFSHLLMQKTGKGFSDLLNGIRMAEGKLLLCETKKPIKEIAGLTGYQNPNYFSKTFKEMFGLTPREYRMKISNKQAQTEI